MQNLTSLASVVPEISLGAAKFKMGHVTLTTPPLKVIFHSYAGTWYSLPYLYTKFDDYGTLRNMVGADQNVHGSRDFTTWPRSSEERFVVQG